MIDAVVGPLGAVDAATGQFQVLGQKVMPLTPGELPALRAGDWVRVSGHRLVSGDIAASRVEGLAVPADALAQVRGPVSTIQGDTFKVADTPINLAALALPVNLVLGQEVWASGEWRGGVLQARQIVAEPTREGLGRVDQVVLEGYIHRLDERELSLGFQPIQLNDTVQIVGGTQAKLAVNRRVQIRGRVGPDQRITAERVEFSNAGSGGASGEQGRGLRGDSRRDSGSGRSSENSGRSGGSGGSGRSGGSGK